MIGSFHTSEVRWFLILGVSYGLLVILFTLYRSVLALRAKRRATLAVQRALLNDAAFRTLISSAEARPFTPEEVERIQTLIRIHTRSLSSNDRRVVDAGLKQNSVRGVRRFVGEVVGHKLAA